MEPEYLKTIAEALACIAASKAPSKQGLGFGPAPKGQSYVFCNRNNGGSWYTLDENSKPVNIEHKALTGYIRKLEFKETIRRNEKSHKLHCYIEGDQLYVLEGSATAHFSKGLLSAIASLTPSQLKQPITLVPSPSTETAEVLFCNLYEGDKQVFAPYNDETDWKQISRAALDVVKAANGELTTAGETTPSVVDELQSHAPVIENVSAAIAEPLPAQKLGFDVNNAIRRVCATATQAGFTEKARDAMLLHNGGYSSKKDIKTQADLDKVLSWINEPGYAEQWNNWIAAQAEVAA
jgi:hypothetical protein